jgi:hypothetical protein
MKLLTFLFDAKEQVGILSKNEDFVYPVKNLGYPLNR